MMWEYYLVYPDGTELTLKSTDVSDAYREVVDFGGTGWSYIREVYTNEYYPSDFKE